MLQLVRFSVHLFFFKCASETVIGRARGDEQEISSGMDLLALPLVARQFRSGCYGSYWGSGSRPSSWRTATIKEHSHSFVVKGDSRTSSHVMQCSWNRIPLLADGCHVVV